MLVVSGWVAQFKDIVYPKIGLLLAFDELYDKVAFVAIVGFGVTIKLIGASGNIGNELNDIYA